jgi:hypothetical protein
MHEKRKVCRLNDRIGYCRDPVDVSWLQTCWRGIAFRGSRSSRPAVYALLLGARLSFRVRLVFPGVRLGLLMDRPLRFPNLIGLLLIESLGPGVAAAPEAREGEESEKPHRP